MHHVTVEGARLDFSLKCHSNGEREDETDTERCQQYFFPLLHFNLIIISVD